MTMVTRRRVLKVHKIKGTQVRRSRLTGEIDLTTGYDLTYRSRQITMSEGHPWPSGRGVRDTGGPFDTLKLVYKNSAEGDASLYSNVSHVSMGPYLTAANEFSFEGNPATGRGGFGQFSLDGQTDDYYRSFVPSEAYAAVEGRGAELISKAIPTNPAVDGSVALAELYREGLPRLIGGALLRDRVGFFRSLGSEYLNYSFGWAPLVADLKAAAGAVLDSGRVLSQLERDSGRNVRRRRYLPPTRTVSSVSSNYTTYPTGVSSGYWRYSPWARWTDETERSTWFSGCFTFYYEPALKSELDRIMTQARLLYGLELSPETLWNLAPWSWLVDWMTNVGPVFNNVSAFQHDGLVMRYGYVMEQTSRTYKVNVSYSDLKVPGHWPRALTEEFSGTRKIRRPATPYGFGLDTGGFNARQWSILTALGITRR